MIDYIFLAVLTIPLGVQIVLGFRLIKNDNPFKLLTLFNIADFGVISYISYLFLGDNIPKYAIGKEPVGFYHLVLILFLSLIIIIGIQLIYKKIKDNKQ